jgi:small subunit ribosomal protein S6
MEDRLYDLIFIVRPDTPDADLDKLIGTLEHAAGEKQAKFEKIEKWGRRRMAYRVKKLREGIYTYISVRSGHGELIKELERRLKVADPVIKYLTIRIDEEMKRQQKLARHREKRAARRPKKQAAPAPSGSNAPGNAPGGTPGGAGGPGGPSGSPPAAPASGGGEQNAPAAG